MPDTPLTASVGKIIKTSGQKESRNRVWIGPKDLPPACSIFHPRPRIKPKASSFIIMIRDGYRSIGCCGLRTVWFLSNLNRLPGPNQAEKRRKSVKPWLQPLSKNGGRHLPVKAMTVSSYSERTFETPGWILVRLQALWNRKRPLVIPLMSGGHRLQASWIVFENDRRIRN